MKGVVVYGTSYGNIKFKKVTISPLLQGAYKSFEGVQRSLVQVFLYMTDTVHIQNSRALMGKIHGDMATELSAQIYKYMKLNVSPE